MKMKRCLIPVFILFFTACQSLSKGHKDYDRSKVDLTPIRGDTYIEASIADASFLNPILATDSASNDINALVFNGLVKYDKDIKLVGELAESWDVKSGGKTIIFKLKKGIKWHDGKDFTSADVLFTYESLINPNTQTAYSSDYLLVKRAETPDPYTFIVTYEKPFAPSIESWGMGIIPKHIFEGGDINKHPANRKPIGTGPYIFDEWETDEKIVLKANPNYFEGRPYLDRYYYRIIPDPSVQFLELRQGSLSSMSLTPDQFTAYDQFFINYHKYKITRFRYDYIGLNLNKPLFQNKLLRKAMAHAINKNDIIDGVYQGLAVESTGPFAPTSWAHNPNVKPKSYDPILSIQLLEQEGWIDSDGDGVREKDGQRLSFTLMTNQGNTVRKSIAQIVQRSFKEVGIEMDIRILEWSVFIHEYIDKRLFDAVLLGWNLSRDPDNYPIWHSSQTGEKQYNFVTYKNEEVDRLIETGRTTFGEDNRRPIYHKIHELIAEDIPYIFLVTPVGLSAIHKKIIGVEEAPAGIGWNFIEWYVPKPWQRKATLSS